MAVNLTDSNAMIAKRLSLIGEKTIMDIKGLFLSKLDTLGNVIGLAPDTLNALQQLGEAINNDSNFYATLITELSFKANAIETLNNK